MPDRVPRGCRVSRRIFVRSAAGALALPWIACRGEGPSGMTQDAAMSAEERMLCLPFLTPLGDFFQQFGGRSTVLDWAMPELGAAATVSIQGLVDTTLSLRVAELEAETELHTVVLNTLMCVSGLRGTAIWTGVPLRALLDRAGVDRARGRRVRFFGADGFENNLKLEDIYDNPADLVEPLLVFRINGQPLPAALGYPFRLLLNDRYGYKNVKWLSRIEVTESDDVTGQYQAAGHDDRGVIEPVPAVETHRIRETVPAGRVELCGFALSGLAPVAEVEVEVDQGAPRPAFQPSLSELRAQYPELEAAVQVQELEGYGFPPRGTWSLWSFELDLEPGEHSVTIRVRDKAGNLGEGTALRITAT